MVLALYALSIFAGRTNEDYPKRQNKGNLVTQSYGSTGLKATIAGRTDNERYSLAKGL